MPDSSTTMMSPEISRTEPGIIRLLLIEEDPDGAGSIKEMLAGCAGSGADQFRLHHVDRISEGLFRLGQEGHDAVLLALSSPDGERWNTLGRVCLAAPLLPVLILANFDDDTTALRAIQEGAQDYLVRTQVDSHLLKRAIRYAVGRKRTENARCENGLRYGALFDGVPVGLYRIAPSGQILDANPALAQMLGYPDCGSLMAINMNETYVAPEISTRWQHLIEREGVVRNFEKHLLRRDGSIIWVEENARVVRDAEGKVQYYEGSLQDITDRKQSGKEMQALQEQLRQSQKLGAIGRLAGGIAHDFNNLLTVIKGYSQLSLMDGVEDNVLRENAEEIQKAADRAADLTRQLLAFSRRQILDMRVLDLNAVIQNLEKILRRVIGEDIELVTQLAEDLGKMKGDVGHLEQIIINLLVNARDAMPSGGRVTLQTKNIKPNEAHAWSQLGITPGRYVRLAVSDTGKGMTPDALEHLFEPFFTTKEQGKGTGLGLSMIYGIVQQCGGAINVNSESERGTTINIHFPEVDTSPEDRENEREDKLPTGNETVLVVEDEEEVRTLTLTVLRKQGYQVFEAAGGKEALSLCRQLEPQPRILVTDVVMPGMSGRELAEHLLPLCPQMKVLYISGYTENAILQDGFLDQGIEFLQKPFSPAALICKVRKILDPAG